MNARSGYFALEGFGGREKRMPQPIENPASSASIDQMEADRKKSIAGYVADLTHEMATLADKSGLENLSISLEQVSREAKAEAAAI